MEEVPEITKDFGQVFCGTKAVEHVKIRNTSKKVQSITVVPVRGEKILYGRLKINPQQAIAPPGKPVRLTLTYSSNVENLIDIMSYHILECDKLVARLNVKALASGPCVTSTTYDIKFFHFRNVNQTIKNVTLENLSNCEAKFCFDLDEDYDQIQISHTQGVLPAKSKISLKIFFNSLVPGTYYKTIFCLIQYHPPLIFKVLCVCQPKLKVDWKDLNLRYPMEIRPDCNYKAYMEKLKLEYTPEGEKFPFLQKCAFERDCLSGTTNAEMEGEVCLSTEEYDLHQLDKNKINNFPVEVFLTTYFVDVKNQPEVLRGTTLVNFSKCQRYYYEWDRDPEDNFRIRPDRGMIEPNMKTYFNIYFGPPESDLLYHVELDLRVFPCECDSKVPVPDIVDLPLTQSLRVLGNSFPDDSFGWIAQCSLIPKTLQLRSCVPDENVYGTFTIERRGHLPVLLNIAHPKETNYLVQPPLCYLSRNFQLFVIEFNGKSKEEGVYSEDLKILFNNSESIYEILKVATSVEIPKLIFGNDNSHTFTSVSPGAQISETISIKNPTNLNLSYEFKTPEDITWYEVVNPTGEIDPNSFSKVTITFKPDHPCKYIGSLPCWVSSISKMDFVKTVHLRLMGSCEYGYLVATPSVHDFGECPYLEEKTIKINLFNFSSVLINFQLTAVPKSFPPGDAKEDVKIIPDRGLIPGKSSLEVQVVIIPHEKDIFQYAILCQNLTDNSEKSQICDDPTTIFSFRFEGVLPSVQILDLTVKGGGKLFSPHWLWKMININRINRGLNSLEREFVVNSRFPEAPVNSPPILITLLIEANRHGDFHCIIRKKIHCPCFEASEGQLKSNCMHSRFANLTPNEFKICANERTQLHFTILYEIESKCEFEWTIVLPQRRSVIICAKITCLPVSENLTYASMYLNPVFRLKPIFIGDISPPLQLFWLYNNNNQPVVYSVVNVTSGKDNSNVQRIFECINPKGVIPSFSSLPLGFLFRPNELKCYMVEVTLSLDESGTETRLLQLQGEGTSTVQQNIELAFEKTIPKRPILNNPNVDLLCLTNTIYISLHRTFSKTKRIFFVKNKSTTLTWSFNWHTFKVDNIISAHIHPSTGRIEPGQKAVMTLIFESFSYATSTSFSLPCDVINYSALKAYEEAVRLQKIMEEKAKDCFTITEKGITYEVPDIKVPEKPSLSHIFLVVKANIFNNANFEMKLLPHQQRRLKAENEMHTVLPKNVVLKISELPPILEALEKNLWNIVNKTDFWRKIKCSKNSSDFKYLQLLPENRKKKKQESNYKPLPICYIQSFFETELREVLSTKLECKTMEEHDMDKLRYIKLTFNKPS